MEGACSGRSPEDGRGARGGPAAGGPGCTARALACSGGDPRPRFLSLSGSPPALPRSSPLPGFPHPHSGPPLRAGSFRPFRSPHVRREPEPKGEGSECKDSRTRGAGLPAGRGPRRPEREPSDTPTQHSEAPRRPRRPAPREGGRIRTRAGRPGRARMEEGSPRPPTIPPGRAHWWPVARRGGSSSPRNPAAVHAAFSGAPLGRRGGAGNHHVRSGLGSGVPPNLGCSSEAGLAVGGCPGPTRPLGGLGVTQRSGESEGTQGEKGGAPGSWGHLYSRIY